MIQRVLVICIGNICRSPIAEGLMRRAWPDKNVTSAGIGAMVGRPAAPFSIELALEHGIDITQHRAQALTAKMVVDAELILTMDLEQKRYLEQKYPTARGKVFRLGAADIGDPYRKDIEVFRHTYNLLALGVDALIERVAHID